MRRPAGRAVDLLLTGGRIFTGNPRQPRAEAIAVRANRIVAVGSAAGLSNLSGRGTRVVDLAGRFACPGFIDCHVHLLMAGLSLTRAALTGCDSREALIEKLRERASSLPEGAWLLGRGWDQERLGGVWPRREWLDEAFGELPVLLYRVDGHVAWASSAALRIAGIGETTTAPRGGEIVRDESGQPTGILKETAAGLVEAHVPPPSAAERREALEAALGELRLHGVTSVHELSPPGALKTFRELHEEGRLTARISAWARLEENLSAAEELRERFAPTDPMIRCDTLKTYLDGTLGAYTAAMIEPYADNPATSGAMQWEEEELAHAMRRAHRSGFQLALHAIGDRAVHVALSALDGLGGAARARRHRIEHAEVVSAGDIPRFLSVGAVASMQPSQLLSDGVWLQKRLGEKRLARAFPWRSLVDQGTPVILGTDWPVEPLDPLRTLCGATAPVELHRQASDSDGGLSWAAARQLEVAEALTAMTVAAAWASFEENIKGVLMAGHLADIVVLSADPFSAPPEEIPGIEIDMTVFDGRVVHSRE